MTQKYIIKINYIVNTIIFLLLVFTSFSTIADSNNVVNYKNAKESLKKDKENLGLLLFFDNNLSRNRTMSCSTCHNPSTGFSDKRKTIVNGMASLGDNGHSIGDRNAPTASYARFTPPFQKNNNSKKPQAKFIGGQFWDGRARTLADQAGGPPINPIEMGMPNKKSVVKRIMENPNYIKQFKKIFGNDIFKDTEKAYNAATQAIQSFEETDYLTPFDSKYDRFLKGEYELTVLEDLGRSLFFSNANISCSNCHKLKKEDAPKEIFTNFEYKNIGVPENTLLRKINGVKQKDLGLYQNKMAKIESSKGKFKTPTLRNVAVTSPYMHNGVFKDLRTVVEFYDHYNNPKRKINPETGKEWKEPEVSQNLSLDELKAKPLTDRKVDALIAFMKTLTDKRYEHLLKD